MRSKIIAAGLVVTVLGLTVACSVPQEAKVIIPTEPVKEVEQSVKSDKPVNNEKKLEFTDFTLVIADTHEIGLGFDIRSVVKELDFMTLTPSISSESLKQLKAEGLLFGFDTEDYLNYVEIKSSEYKLTTGLTVGSSLNKAIELYGDPERIANIYVFTQDYDFVEVVMSLSTNEDGVITEIDLKMNGSFPAME